MENSPILPHPHLLDFLFVFKSKVSSVFKEVLGIHDMHHLSLTRINNGKLLVFSSTPALEYNLFSSSLWSYDKTYDPNWYLLNTQAHWQDLYIQSHFNKLLYVKQIKHNFPLGLSISTQNDENRFIYSLASRKSCTHTQEIFSENLKDFYKIGQYCSNILNPLFNECDSFG